MTEPLQAVIRGHAVDLTLILAEAGFDVRDGAFNEKGRDESDSNYWQVVDLFYAERWQIVNYRRAIVVLLPETKESE